ncbi:alpha/beta hydrolase [Pedobacter nyackensis]|uniref:alpha/beta fold hydrolase n=1 Tax=Pedobacter nyackensis TaxID=475255 RepID=UPI00292FEEE8|nr:alpha/beta hydrolase [Pedobacter nyackensis]
MKYDRKFIIADKARFSYIELNPDKQKTIIFFHGNSNSADLWHLQLSSPSLQSYRLIAVDLPCHGQSEPLSDISIQSFGHLMAQFVIAISNDKPFTLVGLSLGGNIVTEMLPFVPLPHGIVIVSSAIVGTEITPSDIRSTALSEAVLFSDKTDDSHVTLYFNTVLQSGNSAFAELLLEDYNSTAKVFRGKLLKSIVEQRFSNEIDLIRNANIPCLFTVGGKDDVIGPDLLQDISLPLWNNKIHRFSKSGHFINLDQPEEFNNLLDEYIDATHNHV